MHFYLCALLALALSTTAALPTQPSWHLAATCATNSDYSLLPDPLDCTGFFDIGIDGKYYWHGCPTNSCEPNYGNCAESVDDNGRRFCKCRGAGAPDPLCSTHAFVNTTTGLIGEYECVNHGCNPACSDITDNDRYYPCVC